MKPKDNSLSPTKPRELDLPNPPSNPDPKAYRHSHLKSPNIRTKFNALSKNRNASTPSINPQERILSEITQENVFSPQKCAVRLFNSPQISHTSPCQYFSSNTQSKINVTDLFPDIGGLSHKKQVSFFQNDQIYPGHISPTKRVHNKVYYCRTKYDSLVEDSVDSNHSSPNAYKRGSLCSLQNLTLNLTQMNNNESPHHVPQLFFNQT